MAKIYEVRYRISPGPEGVVAHQHETENGAKIDAKAVSKKHGACMLGELDNVTNHMIRAVQFAGGVQGKWANRSDEVNPCRIILTIDDTRLAEPTAELAIKPKEYTEEQIAERKAALEQIRDAQNKAKKHEPASKTTAAAIPDKKEKLVASGMDEALADLICKSGVHIDSPSYKALILLWAGSVDITAFPGIKEKDLIALMTKLRAVLMANNTGKAIANKKVGTNIVYRLVDFVMEVEEVA